jgi:hypothetical protein
MIMNYVKNNQLVEGMTTSENIEAINNLASMYQDGVVKIKDLDVSGTLTVSGATKLNNTLNVSGNTNVGKFLSIGRDTRDSSGEGTLEIFGIDGCGTKIIGRGFNVCGSNPLDTSNLVKYTDRIGIDTFEKRNRLFVTSQTGDGSNFVPYFTGSNASGSAKCSDNQGRNCLRITKLSSN